MKNYPIAVWLFILVILQTYTYGQSANTSDSSSITISLHRGWNWISFPTAGVERNKPALVYDLFKNLEPWPPELLFLEFALPSGPLMYINYEMGCWQAMGALTEIVAGHGYKLLLYPMEGDSAKLHLTGTLIDEQIPVKLEKGSNWVSFFGRNPAYPEQCIPENVFQYILQIKTQYWSMTRITENDTSWFLKGRITPFKFGDLVIIKTGSRLSFTWMDNDQPAETMSIAQPVHFQSEENNQYLPVYFSLDAGSDIREIAVYEDGKIKGAAAREPDDTIVEVRAYFDKLNPGAAISFKTWDGNEEKTPGLADYTVVNHYGNKIEKRHIFTGMGASYYHISLKSSDVNDLPANISKVSCRTGNYGQKTDFSFRLNEQGNLSLRIFDFQGNPVKTLIDGNYPEGYYNLTWNGDNEAGNRVAPGVYFFRVSTCNKMVQTDKIVMIK